MNGLLQLMRNLGTPRLLVMGGVAVGVIVFFIYLTARVASPQMGLLYSDLDLGDSAQVVARLESLNVPFELRGNGNQILVPKNQVLRLRMTMAQEGLPAGGSIGYEIFDRTGSLGTTSFVQNINRLRALEGELGRTIRSLADVREARVHLVLPRREVFSRETREPSASIVLGLRGAKRLDRTQVNAIRHLIASAVPDLQPDRISIIDDQGNLLARGVEDDAGGSGMATTLAEFQADYETRLARAIERLLESSTGFGNVRTEVSADLDFDRLTTNSEIFDPDGQVTRSTQTIEESSTSSDTEGELAVTAGANLPEAGAADGANTASLSQTERVEETVNFEISKTVNSLIRETGSIKRLSVAVLIDGTYVDDGEGNRTYVERNQDELDQYGLLVRTAIGYDEARGDRIEIVNLRFAPLDEFPVVEEEPSFLALAKADYFEIAEILVLVIIAALVILLVLRPLVSRAFALAQPEPAMAAAGVGQIGVDDAQAQIPALGEAPPEEEVEDMIDMAQVEGRVRASSVAKVGEIIDKHPEETLAILRNWLYAE